jgi:N-acetylglucosamine repressor
MITGNHQLIRDINKKKILNTIRLNSPISRTQIADIVKLDKKSITNFINELFRDGLIEVIGRIDIPKGRPMETLSLKLNSYLAIGIDIRPDGINGVLTDLCGNVLSFRRIEYEFNPNKPTVLRQLKQIYKYLKEKANGKIRGIGISIAGIINLNTMTVEDSVNLSSLNGLAFKEELSPLFYEESFYEESSRVKALGEKWFGLGKEYDDFVCIDLGYGIGAGFIFNRQLYKGAGKNAGEIGHVKIINRGKLCRCGSRGCLEAYISESEILKEINTRCNMKYTNLYAIEYEDNNIKRVIQKAGKNLGLGLSILINILNPTTIILNGNLMEYKNIMIPEIMMTLKKNVLKELLQNITIIGTAAQETTALGAASLVFSRLLEIDSVFHV